MRVLRDINVYFHIHELTSAGAELVHSEKNCEKVIKSALPTSLHLHIHELTSAPRRCHVTQMKSPYDPILRGYRMIGQQNRP